MENRTVVINPFEENVNELKPIELCFVLNDNFGDVVDCVVKTDSTANDFDVVELVSKGYGGCGVFDTIKCRDNSWENGVYNVYLGYWNDGVV